MQLMEFEPGEEKLAKLAELIVGLQKGLMAVSERSQVDAIFISALLDELADPAATLRNWQARSGGYFAQKALEYLGNEHMNWQLDELKRRTEMWTAALEGRAQAQDQD